MSRLSLTFCIVKACMVFTLLFVCSIAISQINPSLIEFNIKQGESYSFSISSTSDPEAKFNLEIIDFGNVVVSVDDGTGTFNLDYTAPVDYEGPIEFLVQYTGIIPYPISSYTKFTKIIANVGPSVITPHDDIIIYNGEPTLDIQPCLNDEFSDGPLALVNLAHVQKGTADLLDSATLRYTPPENFQGRDVINYVVQDKLGNKGNGLIYVVSENTMTESDTAYLVVSSENHRYIFLPQQGMALISQSSHKGDVVNVNPISFIYKPKPGNSGKDILVFNDENNYQRTVIVTLIDNAPGNSLVEDDNVYTAKDNSVVFNVSDNDLIAGSSIVYYSPELVDMGNGLFSYTPDFGFTGFKEYKYKVNTGSEIVTGNIKIKVDNYYPAPFNYNFDSPQDIPLILEYVVPITGYEFNVLSPANYGAIEFFGSGTNVSLDCGETQGKAMVLYTPEAGFIGEDEFELSYCITGEQCRVIKISVNVYENNAQDCSCVTNCIWPGDANANGIVNLEDILAIGYYMGETGPARNDIDYGKWHSQNGDEWLNYQAIGPNLKHIDSNGDGVISSKDTLSVWGNLGKYHSIIPSSVKQLKKSPLIFIPRDDDPQEGDLMVIDIVLGNEEFPVLDIHGLTFEMKINPEIVDSATVDVHFYDDSWMANGFGSIQGFSQPTDGVINPVMSKTTRLPISGKGIIGTIVFNIEDAIDGFRPSEKIKDTPTEIPVEIEITNVLAYDSEGEPFTMPSFSPDLTLQLAQNFDLPGEVINQDILDEKLLIFPNPVKEELYIHLNGKKDITSIKIYDLLGRTMHSEKNIALEGLSIDVTQYNEGIYFLEVGNGDEISTQKFKVIR